MENLVPLTARLAQVGLELLGEEEAGIPPSERGRFLPVRVLPGFRRPALPEHPAGYLIVEIDGLVSKDAETIRKAIDAWQPGTTLKVRVRRNPYLQPHDEWWEMDVHLRLPHSK